MGVVCVMPISSSCTVFMIYKMYLTFDDNGTHNYRYYNLALLITRVINEVWRYLQIDIYKSLIEQVAFGGAFNVGQMGCRYEK